MALSATWNASGTTVTFTTPAAHGLAVGNVVYVTETSYSTIDGYRIVATVPSSTTFTSTIDDTTATGSDAHVAVISDITEGFQLDLTSVSPVVETVTPNILYDVTIGSVGFFVATTPETPYRRETAQYRKDQQDNSAEPGEQSLTGWWLRSQSSFHLGCGIKFYEPGQDEKLRFRFSDSQNVDVWTQGEVKLLPALSQNSTSLTSVVGTNAQSISFSGINAMLVQDTSNIYKVRENNTTDIFVASTNIYGMCNDGTYAYWCQNGTNFTFYKKLLTLNSGNAGTQIYSSGSEAAGSGVMAWTKERIIACVNNKIYELSPTASSGTAVPAPIFTHPSTSVVYTGITASGSDIYVSGYNGLHSFILRLTLDTTGNLPTLTDAVVAAEMPRGEIIYSIQYYLGYVVIGTSFGVRVAQVLDGGDLVYGPLFLKTSEPVYGFACDDSYVWCASSVGSTVGLTRINLGTQIDTLVFPWANDRMYPGVTAETTGVAFLGNTDKLGLTAAGNKPYVESSSLAESGYITTGFIRYSTLENKIFKFISDRALYTENSTIRVDVTDKSNLTELIETKTRTTGNNESLIAVPASEFLKFKFTLTRDTATTSQGPVLYGYQVKSLPATPRQRLIQYPLYCFDTEMDRFNNRLGYDGASIDKLGQIEGLESQGDLVEVEDVRSGEKYTGLIEEVSYMAMTPPDRRFSGNGGMLTVTVRKI